MSKGILIPQKFAPDLSPRTAKVRKVAEIYFGMMETSGEKPVLAKAMIQAGYTKATASTQTKFVTTHPEFIKAYERYKYKNIKYEETLALARNKSIASLAEKDFTKEKSRDLSQIFNTLDERLRLQQGLATENIAISAVLAEIKKDNPFDD